MSTGHSKQLHKLAIASLAVGFLSHGAERQH